MLEAVASRIRNRENPENAAVTEAVVQDWRRDVVDGVASSVERLERNRLDALNPSGRTLSPEEIAKINETYDKLVGLYESVIKPVRR
jgi:hypothetical protein